MHLLSRGIQSLPSATLRTALRAGFFVSLFFTLQPGQALAQPCVGSSTQRGGQCSTIDACQSGVDQDGAACAIGQVCCTGVVTQAVVVGTDPPAAASKCTTAYNPCKMPDGRDGYCGRSDDDADSVGLYCIAGASPVTPTTGGGGVGTACKSSNSSETGVCRDRNAPGCMDAGGVGFAPSAQCTAPLECCLQKPTQATPTSGSGSCPTGFTGRGSVCIPSGTGLSSIPIATLLLNVMNWLLIIFGSLAIIAFVISGIQYLLSAGNEDMAEKAKENIKYSIIGVVVALSALVIIRAIDMALLGTPFF